MIAFVWPVALIVLSNTLYQICAKSVPNKMDAMASLTISYLVAALVTYIGYVAINHNWNIVTEWSKTNWAPLILGVVLVGLEFGYVSAYKIGWQVSLVPVVQASILAILLLVAGYCLYREPITWNKVLGIVVCLAGMGLIAYK